MQSEEDKSPGEGAESTIIVFRLAFTSLTNNVEQPAIQFQSEPTIRFKPEPATSSSRWTTASTAANVSIRAFVTFLTLTVLTYNV